MNRLPSQCVLIAGLLSFAAAESAAAPVMHEEDNINIECPVEFQNTINVTKEHILIIKDDETVFDIYRDDMIFYRGEKVDLDSAQIALLKDFSNKTRSVGPEVSALALDAVDLTIDALKQAFSSFDNDNELDDTLSDLRIELVDKIENNQFEYSYSEGEFNMDVIDRDFDKTVEDAVEKIIPTIMGSVFQAIGKAMVDGGSSLEELDNIGDKIEREVELRSAEIESKANLLCEKVKTIDEIETKLSQSHSSLSELNIIRVID